MNGLTDRQREVLAYAAIGWTSDHTGRVLGISDKTVKSLLAVARQKLQAENTTHAVVLALAWNMLSFEELGGLQTARLVASGY